MPDIDDELRRLFARKADEVPVHDRVPGSMMTRARRRIALNAMGVGLGVVLLASGAFAGVRTLGDRPGPGPAGHSTPPPTRPAPSGSATPSPSRPTPSAPVTQACTAAQLQAVAALQGAAGSRVGEIAVTNVSSEACTLEGTPAITLLTKGLTPITTGITFGSSPAGWIANGSPKPAGWPVVTLEPGGAASIRISWGNWCLAGTGEPAWRIAVGSGGTVTVAGFDASMVPPCNGPGQPSTIEEGPFEPRGP